MANDRLRYEITADSKGFVAGVGKAQASAGKLGSGKGKSKSGPALNQLAYAIDDMQYGFRGVQNNVQAFAVQAGAGGPLVLALTVLTVAIGYVIEHWDDFQTETSKSLQAAKDFAGAITKAGGLNASLEVYADILRDSASSTEEKTEALKNLKEHGYDPAKQSLDDFLKVKRKEIALNAAQSVLEEKHMKAAEILAEAEEKKLERAEKQKKFDSLKGPLYNIRSTGLGVKRETTKKGYLADELLLLDQEILRLEEKAKGIQDKANKIYKNIVKSLLGDGESGDAITDDGGIPPAFQDILKTYDLSRQELAKLFQDWLDTGTTGKAELDAFFDTLDADLKAKLTNVSETVSGAGQALQTAIGSAFGDLGEAIGEALAGEGDIGDKFLKSLGKFMQSFGQALIALGIAEAAWLASFDPATKIVAGVALVVAGAAISASYSKKNGSSGSSGSSSAASSPAGSVTPRSTRTSSSNQQLVATVRGQDLRFVLQGANDSYNARN